MSEPMPPKEIRIQLSQFGEYYADRLLLDAATNNTTPTGMVISNCKAHLDAKEKKINQKIQYEADVRGISFWERVNEILGREPAQNQDDDWIEQLRSLPPEQKEEMRSFFHRLTSND